MTELLEEAIAGVRKLSESQQNRIAGTIIGQLESKNDDFRDEFDQIIEECQMSTGISDLSYQWKKPLP